MTGLGFSGDCFLAPVGTELPSDLFRPESPWENVGYTPFTGMGPHDDAVVELHGGHGYTAMQYRYYYTDDENGVSE